MMANRPLDRSWDLSSVARYRKTILSLSFFICIAGVALAGWLQSYRTVIQEITTSRPAPEFDDGKLAFTSVGYRQFVSAEPAGTAFLSWRFNRPVRLQYVTQGFNTAPDPANAMRRVALEFKNAEGQWMQVSTAQWEELPAALHGLTGVAADSGVPSTEWRIRALQAGEADTVNMGWAIPEIERRPGMAGRIENLSLDGVVLGAFLLATFLLAFAFPHVGGLILFAGGCAGVFMIVNGIVFGLLDLPLAFTPDSGTYMT